MNSDKAALIFIVAFCLIILWRVIMIGVESYRINRDAKKKKAAREAKANVELQNKRTNDKKQA
ncbi:MAG: hypothetical protein PHQ91_15110 [Thermoanaerobaculaceae bacterium]|nr:hypothetical protein [Thermoanaerobaculaceae bacterium]